MIASRNLFDIVDRVCAGEQSIIADGNRDIKIFKSYSTLFGNQYSSN